MIQPRPAATPATPTATPAANAAVSWLEIDLDRLASNVKAIKRGLGSGAWGSAGDPRGAGLQSPEDGPRLCGVVKKDAYGLGAPAIAHRMAKAGCDMLAVYAADEAERLVAESVDAPLMLMMPLRELSRTSRLYRHAATGKLHLTVHDPDQLRQLDAIGHSFGLRLPVHLFLDTGMSRSGLSEPQLQQVLGELPGLRFVRCAGICSHLASADEDPAFTERQRQRFHALVEQARPALPADAVRHLANTFATLRDPGLHLDMVRCGLGLLGYGCESMRAMPPHATPPPLMPVLRWLSRVIHVQHYPAGASVGYGATHTLGRDSVLGVVPVGYGDGYPLGLGNRAQVRLLDEHGELLAICPVLGRVNMDQLVIDLTDVPGVVTEFSPAAEGPEAVRAWSVEVIGNEFDAPNALPHLASLAGLHCYAMLCQLSPRLPRRYVR